MVTMIAIIRIRGMVDVNSDVQETLNRLKFRNEIAYGKIDDETLKELIKQRGQKIDKKKEIKTLKGLDFEEANLKPFFRLHPPRGGIKSKEHFPKGVLGNHKGKINDLIRRML